MQKFDPNGGGTGHGGGGGIPGGGSKTAKTFPPFLENGGFAATAFYLFVPSQSAEGGPAYIGAFSAANWDDPTNDSSYSYRMEDVIVGRVPTVRRVILVYRDIGVCTLTISLSGTNDNSQVVSASQVITIGTSAAPKTLITKFVDITLSAFRPQLTIKRAAAAGPVSIISATLIGECEEVSL